jgi:hypothetical protein
VLITGTGLQSPGNRYGDPIPASPGWNASPVAVDP